MDFPSRESKLRELVKPAADAKYGTTSKTTPCTARLPLSYDLKIYLSTFHPRLQELP